MNETLARPHETADLPAPRAQPHSCAVVDKALQAAPTRRVGPAPGTSRSQDVLCPGSAFEPVGAPVGEHVSVMRLRAQRQPDGLHANHRPSSRSHAASSRVCASGQRSSSRTASALTSTRTEANARLDPTRAATKPAGRGGAEAWTLTPSSRSCQRRKCAHQLAIARIGTSFASTYACAVCPKAR